MNATQRRAAAILAAAALATPLVLSSPATAGQDPAAAPARDAAKLAKKLVRETSGKDAFKHLQMFQAIADSSGGHRAAGTLGHDASAAYVYTQLKKAGLQRLVPEVRVPLHADARREGLRRLPGAPHARRQGDDVHQVHPGRRHHRGPRGRARRRRRHHRLRAGRLRLRHLHRQDRADQARWLLLRDQAGAGRRGRRHRRPGLQQRRRRPLRHPRRPGRREAPDRRSHPGRGHGARRRPRQGAGLALPGDPPAPGEAFHQQRHRGDQGRQRRQHRDARLAPRLRHRSAPASTTTARAPPVFSRPPWSSPSRRTRSATRSASPGGPRRRTASSAPTTTSRTSPRSTRARSSSTSTST